MGNECIEMAEGLGSRVALLERDAHLEERVPAAERDHARRAVVAPLLRLGTGPWSPSGEPGAGNPDHLGFLVLDGLLVRRVDLGGAACTELVGDGDVLRPWDDASTDHPLTSTAQWRAVADAEIAVLDASAGRAIGRWPGLMAALLDRSVQRAHSLAFHLAICSLRRVDHRVLAVLWNLSERWGRVTPEGVVVPLPLTHRVLGELVGAQRSSVTSALSALRDRDLVEDRGDRGWLLRGDAPEELDRVRDQLAGRTPPPEEPGG